MIDFGISVIHDNFCALITVWPAYADCMNENDVAYEVSVNEFDGVCFSSANDVSSVISSCPDLGLFFRCFLILLMTVLEHQRLPIQQLQKILLLVQRTAGFPPLLDEFDLFLFSEFG